MTETHPPRHAPRTLWLIAQNFMLALHTLFGAPEDIAASSFLTRSLRRQLAQWLATGEAMLRRLLLIEAAALPAMPVRQTQPKVHAARKRRIHEFAAAEPETWRVTFRCFPARASTTKSERQTAAAVKPREISGWPLAERYEALLRAYNNPAPYAARLARRIDRDPACAYVPLRTSGPTERHVDREAFASLTSLADECVRKRFDSS